MWLVIVIGEVAGLNFARENAIRFGLINLALTSHNITDGYAFTLGWGASHVFEWSGMRSSVSVSLAIVVAKVLGNHKSKLLG